MPEILTELHGNRVGLGANNELIFAGQKIYANGREVVSAPAVGAANGSGVVASESGNGVINKTVLTLTSTPVVLADEAGVVAYGGLKVYDFPAGNILVLGAVADLDIVKSSAGVNNDFDGDVGVGTVTASNNNSLSSTEQNIIGTTSTPQAVSGATTANCRSADTVTLDGTTTPADVFLNFLVDDADHNVGGTPCNIVVTGTMTLHWINLGDF